MKTDEKLARNVRLLPVAEVASAIGIPPERLIHYGSYAAKVTPADHAQDAAANQKPDARLVVVTAMSPTPAGEGKTTLTIGLAQSLKLLGKSVAACIRQPSLGPFFGAKGGATGGGLSQVLPREEISLEFTGDDYAVVTAHNLISSVIDNHIYHNNPLGIDPARIFWPRVSTINDRALRRVMVGLGKLDAPGGKGGGSGEFERRDEFHISAASELASILCLSTDIAELKERVARLLVALDSNGGPVRLADLKVEGAVTALLKKALYPNLVQSTEGVPVFVHGGPFGNISIGCSSLTATKLAMGCADYVLTEAGFSTELGCEKFFDIKCRVGGITPHAAVIVATLNALRLHGRAADFTKPEMGAVKLGMENLAKHIENVRAFGLPALVVLNRFAQDTDAEIEETIRMIEETGARGVEVKVRDQGGSGGIEAARALTGLVEEENNFKYLYETDEPAMDKVSRIACTLYGAAGVEYTAQAERDLEEAERLGYGALPVCIAKTPRSLSDDPSLLGRPTGFRLKVGRVSVDAGAGYLVALCGKVLLMPGLPVHPRAEDIDLDENGKITGL